ncbi:hypothetical protein QQP08_015673 [Theobroma cacao]|nr:hypothetical protein QQP08_015673 [Theobroma cacao]
MILWLFDFSKSHLVLNANHKIVIGLFGYKNKEARLLISSASSPTITRLTALSISSFITLNFVLGSSPHLHHSLAPTSTPIFRTSVTSFSLQNCSAQRGQVTIGTPAVILSIVEFHPQWVMNPPTAS